MLKISMTPAHTEAGWRTPFTRAAVALVAGAAIAGTGLVASPAQAAGTPAAEQSYAVSARGKGITLKSGPILAKKYGFSDEHLGLLTTGGQAGICYDYGEKSPDGSFRSGPIADVKPGRARDRMQWIANAYWGDAQKSDSAAAAYKSSINLLRSKEFASDWKVSYVPQLKAKGKASVVTLTDRMLAESAVFAGAPKVTIDASKPAPGGKGVAVVKLTVGGKAYPGRPVKWAVSGAVSSSAGKTTSKDGTAKLTFVRGAGPVSVAATATVPEWREAGYTVPSRSSIQHLIRGGFTTSLKASTKFDSLAGVTVSSKCDGTCDGRPPVTFNAKASSSPMQVRAVREGKTLKTLTLAPGKAGSATFTGADGVSYGFQFRVQVAGKWSVWRTATSFTAVCPAAPVFTFAGGCDCAGKGLVTFHVTAPGGSRSYDITLAGTTKRISGRESADLSVPVAQLATAAVTWSAVDKAGKRIGGGVLTPWTS